VFADPEQARAAAGMALLLGYGEGERTLSAPEEQLAREAGFGILAEAFGAPQAAGVDPNRNAAIEGTAPAFGGVRTDVEGAGLRDPGSQAAGVRGQVEAHQQLTRERYDPTEVDRAQARQREESAAFGARSGGALRADKRAHYAELLREEALLPRPYPQIAADEVGGFLTKFAQSGALARAGLRGLAADGIGDIWTKAANTYAATGDWGAALEAAGSGWQEARTALIDTRLEQVKGYGLTAPQLAFFRAATESLLPSGVDSLLGTDAAKAREAAREVLIKEDGETGQHIAELLMRSVISQDDTYLRTIGAFNRASTGTSPVSPPLSQAGVDDSRPGALLDLVAAPESGGNYNAWYGDAGQAQLDLSTLSVNQVRALQSELVRSQGGSAIGRYQLLDDTLDGLVDRLGLTGSEPFTPALQDRMALELARDAGMDAWIGGRLSDTAFAQNLAEIWAGLPKDASNASRYEGLQGNRARADWQAVLASLEAIRGRP
jgi:conjugal transfer mating pair stabilization protein TraG